MKIAIPADDKTMESVVCPSFGRAPYFVYSDTKTDESVFLENAAAQSEGGAGIKAAQSVADSGAQVLLTPRLGENAAEVLKGAGIEVYKTIPGSIQENIAAFKAGTLSPLTVFHAGFHGHGG